MTAANHRTPWKDMTAEQRITRVQQSEEAVLALIRKHRRDEANERRAKWMFVGVTTFIVVLLAVLGWLTQSASGRALMAWMDGL
jgi:F0F1-type ATP synthase membrane subunit a